MTYRATLSCLAAALLLAVVIAGPARAEDALLHHDLDVRIRPGASRVEADDHLRVPAALRPRSGPLEVLLHADLELAATDEAWVVTAVPDSTSQKRGGAPSRMWHVQPADGAWPSGDDVVIPLRFSGVIHHPLEQEQEDYARSFSRTVGTIGKEGVVLSRGSWWVPTVGEETLTFTLSVELPEGWDVVSEGTRTRAETKDGVRRVTWDCPHPMEEVYLICGQWTEYDRRVGRVEAMAFLRKPDDALAARYLEATDGYIRMYEDLIGPYPFGKFALVENFWETGYGMPSFTLLGPQVIRLPFILHSSYPHEILHNWWGNSVYVDWKTGNWCEGLTVYLADHLLKEKQGRGQGVRYRRDTLKKYRSHVRGGTDFPLTEFRSRHSGATEAIGYGKSMMVFHMLRRRLGDARFKEALRSFYKEQISRQARWADLARSFSEAAGEDLLPWIKTWTERAGAPALKLEAERMEGTGLRIRLTQTQDGAVWPVDVPVAVTFEGVADAQVTVIPMRDRVASVEIETPARVMRVDADPTFDVFRRLDLAETPPTLGEVFGAERVTLVVPDEGADPLAQAWMTFAKSWQRGGAPGAVAIVREGAIEALPADRALWILGSKNRWAQPLMTKLEAHGADFTLFEGRSVVMVTRHPASDTLAAGWVASDIPASLPGLARKLPHYGKYSYLAFEGDAPTNVVKGEWPVTTSPLTVLLADAQIPRGEVPQAEPLARPEPLFEEGRLMMHVRVLADDALEGRGVGTAGLGKARRYIEQAFQAAGLEPGGDDDSYLQTFEVPDGPKGTPEELSNVVGFVRGRDPARTSKIVVIGAHYDHLGYGWPDVRKGHEGKIHNGADDNASGISVLLEIARRFAQGPRPARTVVFVAFSGEEWGLKGSRHFAADTTRWPIREALAMLNLDTVGRLGDKPLMILGTGSATEWPHIARGIGFTTGVASTSVAEDPEGSDQTAFTEIGVPAVQLFTGAHADYHRSTDDVEKIDAAGLVKVATWVREALNYLADRPEGLTPPGTKRAPAGHPGGRPGGSRGLSVSLGTVPSFEHRGFGVLVDGVLEGSPAEAAGIRKGDLLIAMDGAPTTDLRVYTKQLRACKPGDVIRLGIRRDGKEIELEATLAAR